MAAQPAGTMSARVPAVGLRAQRQQAPALTSRGAETGASGVATALPRPARRPCRRRLGEDARSRWRGLGRRRVRGSRQSGPGRHRPREGRRACKTDGDRRARGRRRDARRQLFTRWTRRLLRAPEREEAGEHGHTEQHRHRDHAHVRGNWSTFGVKRRGDADGVHDGQRIGVGPGAGLRHSSTRVGDLSRRITNRVNLPISPGFEIHISSTTPLRRGALEPLERDLRGAGLALGAHGRDEALLTRSWRALSVTRDRYLRAYGSEPLRAG